MRMRRLAQVLLRASLIAVPTAGCCAFTDDGTWHEHAARADYPEEVDRCIADEADCWAVCSAVLWDRDTTGEKEVDACRREEIVPDGVNVEIEWSEFCEPAGRRPRGFCAPRVGSRRAGTWLARVATLEAASITAFARLVRSLTRLDAPRPLVAAARRAIGDEIRHARLVAGLARRFGARPVAPVVAAVAEPSLAELAHENAVEGQVGETFGALAATCQARAATDPAVRAAFGTIARDETRHAALAHRLAPWLERQLAPSDRAAVRDARRDAIARISPDWRLPDADRAVLGLPAPAALRAAAAQAFAALA